ncbi:MAG: hypothetical protein CM1200mP3_02140 [Chloroflexota bacterium]|nr:MAG: hypothetical protein CM1200mP3_02140 [Chloroflexota bacterium]
MPRKYWLFEKFKVDVQSDKLRGKPHYNWSNSLKVLVGALITESLKKILLMNFPGKRLFIRPIRTGRNKPR